MSPGESRTNNLLPFLLLIGIVALALAAFWVLLNQRYSPETFRPVPIGPDTVELSWIGGALVVAVFGLVALSRSPRVWSSRARQAIPLAAAAVLVSRKAWLGAPIRMYDMMLFAVACGWSTYLWLRARETATSQAHVPALRVAVVTAVALLTAWQFWQQVVYLNNLALGYADCGENARLLFNTLTNPRELFLRVNPDKPLFYDHVDPGILPFVPLWLLWPDLKLTIALQLVAVFGAVVPLYWIGKRVFRDRTSPWLLVVAWMVLPSTSQFIYSASYGFRWGNMCLLFYFIALAFWIYDRPGWALAMAVWAILIKEEAAIVVGMFGVYLAVFERRRMAGITLAAVVISYFLVTTSILIPAISGQPSYPQARFFHQLGATNWQILMSPLLRPRVFWGKVLEPSSFYFAGALLGPLLFVPLRKPSVLVIGLPTFVFCCMNQILKSISFHYQAGLLPVIFWALVCAVQPWEERRRRNVLASAAACGVIFSIFLGAQPWSKDTLVIRQWPGRLALAQRMVGQLARRDTLVATQRLAAHYITQRYLYLDPSVPAHADDALLDLRDSWRMGLANLDWLARLRDLQRQVEAIPGLHLAGAVDGLVFYSRHGTPLDAQQLVTRDRLPADATRVSVDLDGVHIAGFTLARLPGGRRSPTDRLRITGFFDVASPTNLDLAARCIVYTGADPATAESYTSDFQPLGQGVWPVARWETNRFYAEDFLIDLPAGLAQDISTVSFAAVPLSPAAAKTAAKGF
jgi:uncharacterized membrane protein